MCCCRATAAAGAASFAQDSQASGLSPRAKPQAPRPKTPGKGAQGSWVLLTLVINNFKKQNYAIGRGKRDEATSASGRKKEELKPQLVSSLTPSSPLPLFPSSPLAYCFLTA
mmetsp:Transcript_47622/g.123435  ORF Transcript_47622/g.123435 Transcript_47622/m.123435 type:complete len:112 (-) Transcript_47622:2308-2643(-)